MIGKIAAEDYGLTAVESTAEGAPIVKPKVRVLFLPPYRTPENVSLERAALARALEKEFIGCQLEITDVEPSFEEPMTGEFYWMAPYARQAAETKKRYRKQVLAGIVTVLRAVGRLLPDFIVGIQQGAMIAALCSTPCCWKWRRGSGWPRMPSWCSFERAGLGCEESLPSSRSSRSLTAPWKDCWRRFRRLPEAAGS